MAAMKMDAGFREATAVYASSQGASLSLHAGDPGVTGANELYGGSPAYSRATTTWTAGAADGSVTGSEVEFNIPPGSPTVTPTHLGCWSGPTFKWAVPIANITYPGQAKVRITPTLTVPQG